MKKTNKKPKGFQLPVSVIEWLDFRERMTGATLSRIALAALCHFRLAKESEQNEAMRWAVAVEKGGVDFKFLRKAYLQWSIEHTKAMFGTVGVMRDKEFQKTLKLQIAKMEEELSLVQD